MTPSLTPSATDSPAGSPTAALPEDADHSLTIQSEAGGPEVFFALTFSESAASEADVSVHDEGVLTHVRGQTDDVCRIGFSGRLLSIKLEPSLVALDTRDPAVAPITVRRDGEAIDFERWDPAVDGDLPVGYGGSGAMPTDLTVRAEDCDRIVTNRAELLAAADEVADGAIVGVGADVHLPEEPGRPLEFDQDDLCIAGVTPPAEPNPTLYRDTNGEGWGNWGLAVNGDRALVTDLQLRGGLDYYVPERDGAAKLVGLAFTGDQATALNCHAYYFSHAAFSTWGTAATYLCVDAHHNLLGGLGYGVVCQGPIGQNKDWEAGETWSAEEMATYTPWDERTEMKRIVFDANRHDVAAGTNASYSVRTFVVGPTTVSSTRIDMHRPGGGAIALSDGIFHNSERGVPEGNVHGFWVRGWPNVGARLENVWFGWGEEPDPEHRYPNGTAPIVQVNATPETRRTRGDWDSSNGPFERIAWYDCTFGGGSLDTVSDAVVAAREKPIEWIGEYPEPTA
jgi:hypothetical protein